MAELLEPENDRLREAMWNWLRANADRTKGEEHAPQSRLAEALQVALPSLNKVLMSKGGASFALLRRFCQLTHTPLGSFLDESSADSAQFVVSGVRSVTMPVFAKVAVKLSMSERVLRALDALNIDLDEEVSEETAMQVLVILQGAITACEAVLARGRATRMARTPEEVSKLAESYAPAAGMPPVRITERSPPPPPAVSETMPSPAEKPRKKTKKAS